MHIAYISVGSNLGDRLQNCRQGITALTRRGDSRILAQSRMYMTEPVDYEDQDWFINMAVKLETTKDPFELLDTIKSVQRAAGRKHDEIRFGPRVLGLDIIFFDDLVLDSDRLVVPHPRMHQRRFVLKPICDIDPTIIHPLLKKDMQSLLDGLAEDEQKVIEFKWSNS
ncbi:MAG: 2-amino-4-hydroxy-6-hydroxymethyldihydropteridine diphosphokinase [Deltaproteobacteria bacterium]|nr:2-amino-4-hydroxy-6-hydroxymethyldihydropteridine diphosphokinase [Deltaproteobacteria bacterium]